MCINYASGTDVANATATAAVADVVLMFVATDSEEGTDRGSLNLGSQDALIAAVAAESGCVLLCFVLVFFFWVFFAFVVG